MRQSDYTLRLLICLSPLISSTVAQVEQVLSTFIYTHHGERTPLIWAENPSLTALGARQAWQAGVNIRNTYVLPPSNPNQTSYTIRDISSTFLDNRQINILTSTDEWAVASAQAFMQGLFPPLTDGGRNVTNIAGESDLANGTVVLAPLGGYQYPNIAAVSPYDLRSIFVKGTDNCPNYNAAMLQYYKTADYENRRSNSQAFYDGLKEPLLNGVFDPSAVGYFDAYYIWDYLNYGRIHNASVAMKLDNVSYTTARLLAGNWMLGMYANVSTTGSVGQDQILDIAGRTLATNIIQSFLYSIQTQGKYNKMNLVFGDYKPMMSFAALTGLLKPSTGAFFNAPLPGSSYMIELFTYKSQTSTSAYPKSTDMFVRFLYQDSTDVPFRPVEYSLFKFSPGAPLLTWAEFVSAMSGIMLSDVDDWCTVCGSASVFCATTSTNAATNSGRQSGLNPAIAGVIGAITALAFFALVVGLVMLFGGIRFYRRGRRGSEAGGYKGSEKLASDQDLSVPKGGAGATIHETPRGHERASSWELKESVKARDMQPGIDTSAFDKGPRDLHHDDTTDDPYGIPVKPRDTF